MNLDYSVVQEKLEIVRAEIDNLINYLEINQSRLDGDYRDAGFIDLNVYARLAEISKSVLECSCEAELKDKNNDNV